jgi:hypothetical protein
VEGNTLVQFGGQHTKGMFQRTDISCTAAAAAAAQLFTKNMFLPYTPKLLDNNCGR